MRWTDQRSLSAWLLALALAATAAAAVGVPIRATYGARTTADEPQYLLTALSLGEDGDLDIADELRDGRWQEFHEAQLPEQTRPLAGGRRISPHDPLLPMYLALPMRLGGWPAAKSAMTLLVGALAALTAWVAIRRFGVSTSTAAIVTGVFFVSAPLAPYGTQIYPELPAALCTLAAAALVTGPFRTSSVWWFAGALVALPWLAIKYAPVAAVLALYGLARLTRERRHALAVAVTAGLAAAGLTFVGVHLVVWEGLTAYASGDHFVGGEFTAVGNRPDYAGRSRRLIGLLVDREFGLAAWQPAWLLAVPGFARFAAARPPHWVAVAATFAVGWLTATFVALTMHGYWFPGRQVIVVLPLAVVALAVVADRSRPYLLATAGLGLIGIWSYAWLVYAGLRRDITWVFDFYTVGDPWYRSWSLLLPAYRYVSADMWIRHGVWLMAAAVSVLLALGLHRGGRAAR